MVTAGTRLGPYEVVALLGAGGMGEVYMARDTRLERSVAIKILPAEFAQNGQLRARFEREAKSISALNHPNICTLHDVGNDKSVEYLVMEYIEGETLAGRLARGPLPLDAVLRYGEQIAEALDCAHRSGIVHRDLKPGNVMITKSGAKLLDFGLARDTSPIDSPVHDPQGLTATAKRAITEEGSILGTVQYMAPEQIEGAAVDARTDIFALGAVLYEMATGRRAFEGKSKASTIAAILTADPQPLSALQPASPAALDLLIRACLSKDPDARWQSARDVAHELRTIAGTGRIVAGRSQPSRVAWGFAAFLAVLATAASWLAWREVRARQAEGPVRTFILPPEKNQFWFRGVAAPPAMSPDGKRLVFGAADEQTRDPSKSRLWVRALDSLEPHPLPNTEGAIYPFWSPDGRAIGFFVQGELRSIELNSGAIVRICEAPDGRGGTWSPDGRTIVFGGRSSGLYRVAAAGGEPAAITRVGGSFATHRWPQFLPDGRHLLYLAGITGNEDPGNAVFVTDLDGRHQTRLMANTDEPHYAGGAILFSRNHVLTAQRFDVSRLELIGDAVPVNEQGSVETSPVMSHSMFAVASGTAVYQPGTGDPDTVLSWFDRAGKLLGTVDEPAPHVQAVLSPDQKTAALAFGGSSPANIWVLDLARAAKTRVTFAKSVDAFPVWSPDGRRLLFSSLSSRGGGLFMKDLTTGVEEQLVAHGGTIRLPRPTSWSADGQRILFSAGGPSDASNIYWISLPDRSVHPYLVSPYRKLVPRFSPDGRWVVYQSDESGRFEIYLAPFPPTGAKWAVSNDGGAIPRWRADGKEIFYIGNNYSKLMAVSIDPGPMPVIGRPKPLFDVHLGTPNAGAFDVTPDGQRFLVNSGIRANEQPAPLVVVQHFDNVLAAALSREQ